MRHLYAVEYRDERGEIGSRREDIDLTRQRACDLAKRWVVMHPMRVAVVYFEVEKPNGKDKEGNPKWAQRTETSAIFQGRGYKGPRVRSTMMRQGKIEGDPVLVKV